MSGQFDLPRRPLDRRAFLRASATLSALAFLPALNACGGGTGGGSGGGAATTASGGATGGSAAAGGSVTFGLNANAAIPTAGYDALFQAFTAESGIEVKTNKLLYTEQVNNYLTSAPDDVLIWNAGYRMRFFAEQELVSDLSSVWATIGANISDAVKQACTAADGKQYLVPFYTYPWVVYYRKSVFADGGYSVPTTRDELVALCQQMQSAGITPFAFADNEGWEAMGTFDILNMRVNGYDFHISLLDGKESWTDDRVKKTFATWAELLPFHQTDALGRTWQEGAQSLQQGSSAMYLMGSFLLDQFEDADLEDLDFFPFPAIDAQYGQDAIDAPIDGFMMVREPDNRAGSETLLTYLGSGAAQDIYLATDKNSVGVADDVDTSVYSPIQKKFAEVLAATPNIAQYLDRDTRPDFAAPVIIPAIQSFLQNPSDIDSILDSVQSQAESIFVD